MRKFLTLTAAAFILVACGQNSQQAKDSVLETVEKASVEGSAKTYPATIKIDSAKLKTVLAAQSEKTQVRFGARHPQETLEFFGIAPGMAVGEALPGGGWYTKILVPYLGEEGRLVGIDYSIKMWSEFSFANEAFIEGKKKWPEEFVSKSAEWAPADGAKIAGTTFGRAADEMTGQLDAVLFIRALHNLSRFEGEGQFLTQALKTSHSMLKQGGIVGVVQHRAPSDADETWVQGDAGYLKQANVVAAFDAAGFDLVKSSEINANPKDKPTSEDVVWRLPPTMAGVGDDEALKVQRLSIGESDRMTLLFKKR